MPTSRVDSASGFHRFEFPSVLERNIRSAGYTSPRPIQEETLEPALNGRDILGLAQTGTGKTAAFALPILDDLLNRRRRRGPHALVVAPTRELAVQIDAEFQKLAKGTRISSVVIFGGVKDGPQIQKLRRGPDVIVACPGRLLDLMGQGVVDLRNIDTLVLDEADHMFDMGFLPDIRRILRELPRDRQNLLFAATMPREVRRLAESILDDPFVAELAHSAPAHTIDHALYPVVEGQKQALLEHFLRQEDFASAIVFTRTKFRAKRLAQKLEKKGHRTVALQGNMSQPQRDRAMKGFRNGQFDVLVATDIVARGIDVEQVSHVINFDVPNTPEAYTHRIGRTGRSERSGQAFTFVTADDRPIVQAIEKRIGKRIRIESVEGFDAAFEPPKTTRKRNGSRGPGKGGSGRPGSGRGGRGNGSRSTRGGESESSRRKPKRRRKKTQGTRAEGSKGQAPKSRSTKRRATESGPKSTSGSQPPRRSGSKRRRR